ncbi:MAG: DUF4861 domain-containing protein [Bacteroidia bacterium]|nr:DUF4861 domain-containing protein [Bacteroidia bacterium]
MKKLVTLLTAVLLCLSYAEAKRKVTVTIANALNINRSGEMVEIDKYDVLRKLQCSEDNSLIVLNENGQQVPYQFTYDQKIIFPVNVKAKKKVKYTLLNGQPQNMDTLACGKYYPERMDDVAWENDLVAFRAYGPTLQKRGEKAFGYDVFTKYNTTKPVVEARYADETNKEKRARIAELKKSDSKAADELAKAISYHIDHGNGMDCYAVGPTLGGGASALMVADSLIYPYCYETYEILDNGPLRFTLRLVFTPLAVGTDTNVIETRLITLDAGSYLNKTVITYANLTQKRAIATGIVLHEPDGRVTARAQAGFITYVDPTTNPKGNNGKMFMGAAFPTKVKEAKAVLFSEKEKKELRGGADGHVMAMSEYSPKSAYTYYWGSAWSKGKIKTPEAWDEYMLQFTQNKRTPLTVTTN